MELTLGAKILKAVVFDRDYRSDDEVAEIRSQLNKFADLAHIHSRKETENYLLEPAVIDRALKRRITEHNKRTDDAIDYAEKAEEADNKESAELLTRMAEEERRHYLLLGNIIEFVSRPSQWLEDAEWNHLEAY